MFNNPTWDQFCLLCLTILNGGENFIFVVPHLLIVVCLFNNNSAALPCGHCTIAKCNDCWRVLRRFCWQREGSIGSAVGVCSGGICHRSVGRPFLPATMPSIATSISPPDALVSPLTLVGRSVVLGGDCWVAWCSSWSSDGRRICSSSSPRSQWLFAAKLLAWRHGQSGRDDTNPFFGDVRRDWYCLRVGGHGGVVVEATAVRGSKNHWRGRFWKVPMQMTISWSKKWVEAAAEYLHWAEVKGFLLIPLWGYNSLI